ncbi:MAG: HlyD family type I secretion periplasmic adaptor subunit [Gallionella sp.]|nr:HlyD family type I secretion periplasmic adaptor subunit [Gallionella sp.]MDD4959209.1 HlyD family type I secretion periplasmic adaptor subunit [Gallionella sp.]
MNPKKPKPASHWRRQLTDVDPLDFSPGLLRIQAQPPTPFARMVLYSLLVLFAALLIWAAFGKLDVVASAEGKLLPQSYLKIVQPSEQGIIREILVAEGQEVKAGQVLMRMDTTLSDADGKEIQTDFLSKQITLRRIDAELAGQALMRLPSEDPVLFQKALNQYTINRTALDSALSEERAVQNKAQNELASAQSTRSKLLQTLPHYLSQDQAYRELVKDGYVSQLAATDKTRERIEKEQDLQSQIHLIEAARASLQQSRKRYDKLTADYRRQLQIERVDISDKLEKLEQEHAKQQYRAQLHELKASQDGIVKDLATHTLGTVISPGTILMTLVPHNEILRAEVWVDNQDVGFIHTGEPVKIKFAAYQFQKYGMVEGQVSHLSADASDNSQQNAAPPQNGKPNATPPFTYRALIDLKAQKLIADGIHHKLTPGMQVTAEIHLGTRSILEYLLSPVVGAFQEAARER